MWLIAAIASALIFGTGGFIYFVGIRKGYQSVHLLSGLYLSGSTCFFLLLISQKTTFDFSASVLLFGILIGAGSLLANYFTAKAFQVGPASLTSPLVNLNVLAVIFMSIFIFGESPTRLEFVGIALLLLAVTLILYKPNKNQSIHSAWWYVFLSVAIVFTFFREGGLKISDSFHLNNINVLLYAYLFALLCVSIKIFVVDKKLRHTPQPQRTPFLLGLMAGCCSATGMTLFVYGIAHGPASIVAPIFSARSFVVAILALWIYKERLSVTQWCAVVSLLLGLTVLDAAQS